MEVLVLRVMEEIAEVLKMSQQRLGLGSLSKCWSHFESWGSLQRGSNVHVTPTVWRRPTEQVMAKSAGKGKSKKMDTEIPKQNPKVTKVPKVRTRVKPRKLILSGVKTRNQRQVQKLGILHRRTTLTTLTRTLFGSMIAGDMMNGMMTGVLLDGIKVGNKAMKIPQAHCHREVLILVQ